MSRVDEKMTSKNHNHKKAHDTNSSRMQRKIREAKRNWESL